MIGCFRRFSSLGVPRVFWENSNTFFESHLERAPLPCPACLMAYIGNISVSSSLHDKDAG